MEVAGGQATKSRRCRAGCFCISFYRWFPDEAGERARISKTKASACAQRGWNMDGNSEGDAQRLKTSGESHCLKNLKAPRVAFTSQNRTRLSNVGCRLSGLVPWSSARISDRPACKRSHRSHRHAAAAVLLPQRAATDKPVFVQIDWGTPQHLAARG